MTKKTKTSMPERGKGVKSKAGRVDSVQKRRNESPERLTLLAEENAHDSTDGSKSNSKSNSNHIINRWAYCGYILWRLKYFLK